MLEGKSVEKDDEVDAGWPDVKKEDLPVCPKCQRELLRPGVVWFRENLDEVMMGRIDRWLEKPGVDLCLVIGTSGTVYPAAA